MCRCSRLHRPGGWKGGGKGASYIDDVNDPAQALVDAEARSGCVLFDTRQPIVTQFNKFSCYVNQQAGGYLTDKATDEYGPVAIVVISPHHSNLQYDELLMFAAMPCAVESRIARTAQRRVFDVQM